MTTPTPAPSMGVPGVGNQLFGTPNATTSGAAGKTGITQGPQMSLGAKGGSNLGQNASTIIANTGQLGGGKV